MSTTYYAMKLRALTAAKTTIEEMVDALDMGTFDPEKLARLLLATRDDLNLTIDLVQYMIDGTEQQRLAWDDEVRGRCLAHGILANTSAVHRRDEHRPSQD